MANMLKYILILFFFFAQPAFANGLSDACDLAEGFAGSVMRGRQAGQDKQTQIDEVDSIINGKDVKSGLYRQLVKVYIDAAYEIRMFDTKLEIEYAISEFKRQSLKQCYQVMMN